MPNKLVLYWIDEDGTESRSSWWTAGTDPTAIGDLISALRAVSHASLGRYGILTEAAPAVAIGVGTGPYDIADKGVLEFLDAAGATFKFAWPCPSTAIFAGSSDVIDVTRPDVTALGAAVSAAARTRGGEAIITLVRGYRIRTRRAN